MADARLVNRSLLRSAGEHLGTLAEHAKHVHDGYTGNRRAGDTRKKFYNEYAKLLKLSHDVLEIANG